MAYFPQVAGRAARGLVCVNHEYVERRAHLARASRRRHEARRAQGVAGQTSARGRIPAGGARRHRSCSSIAIRHGWTRELSRAREPPHHRAHADGHPRSRARPRAHAHQRGSRRHARARHVRQLLRRQDAVGHVPHFRRKRRRLFRGRQARCASSSKDAALVDAYRRFPLRENSFYGWDVQDPRFDARAEPHEALRFGWMVEIDPHDPKSVPRKRTSLGRFQHEGANTIVGKTGHVAAYMGDDEKFEYIYKFVTRDRFDAKNPAANRDLLDHGTLYCARFDADGTGEWLPLVHDENGPLNSRAGFANQGDVVIKVRAAADLLGATPMDRPGGRRAEPRHRPHLHSLHQDPRTAASPKTTTGPAARSTSASNAANPRPDNKSGPHHRDRRSRRRRDGDAIRVERVPAGRRSRGRTLHRRRARARARQAWRRPTPTSAAIRTARS